MKLYRPLSTGFIVCGCCSSLHTDVLLWKTFFPLSLPHLSAVPLRLPELCLQLSITFCFSAASIFKRLTEAAVSSEGREGWENWGERRRWMENTGVREGKGGWCMYQDGRWKWKNKDWQYLEWRPMALRCLAGCQVERINRGWREQREGGSLVLLQASGSTETTDWMNRKQETGRGVCLADRIQELILLD